MKEEATLFLEYCGKDQMIEAHKNHSFQLKLTNAQFTMYGESGKTSYLSTWVNRSMLNYIGLDMLL